MLTSLAIAVVTVSVSGAWRFTSRATLKLRDRARASTELRMAVEYLRQDLGGAASAEPGSEDKLVIRLDDTVYKDCGTKNVKYYLEDGALVRDGRQKTVVALGVTRFFVEQPFGSNTVMEIATGTGSALREVTLVWSP